MVLFIQSGAWIEANRRLNLTHFLVDRGFATVSIDHRLIQQALFPAQIIDAKAAVRWIRANAPTYGFDPDRIGVWEISSNGHLAALLGTTCGSLARLDAGGALRVGPQSAGADPGPACYGRGDQPTVTDANLLLGRLRTEAFLGGAMTLDAARAESVLTPLADDLGMDVATVALGIVRIANAAMERAIRNGIV